MLVTLTLNTVAFNFSYGFAETVIEALGGGTDKVILSQRGSKVVYTSRVPLSLAESLNRIDGVHAQAVTLTPTTIREKPIVFRGVTSTRKYVDYVIEGFIPQTEGLWFIIGEEAYKRLNLRIGEIVPVGSPLNSDILLLKIVAVYRTGSQRDWEAVIPFSVGRALADLPEDMANMLEVEGLAREELEHTVSKIYHLKINYEFHNGRIYIFDSMDALVECIDIDAPGSKDLLLPFGYYRVAYQSSYLMSNMTSLLLNRNCSLNLGFSSERLLTLKVLTSRDSTPLLHIQNGEVVRGDWLDGFWIFRIPSGFYELEVNGLSYPISMVEDTVFNPSLEEKDLNPVTLRVLSHEGEEFKDYVVTVRNMDGEIVFSTFCPTSYTTLFLPSGTFEVEVSKPPYIIKEVFSTPDVVEVNLKLHAYFNPHKIPLSLYEKVGVYTKTEKSRFSLQMILGLSTEAMLASTLTLLLLSMIAAFTVQTGLYNSSKENLRLLNLLGAGKIEFLKIIGIPILILNLAIGILAGLLSIIVIPLFLKTPTIFGYGVTVEPGLTISYSASLSVVSWLYSNLRLHRWVED